MSLGISPYLTPSRASAAPISKDSPQPLSPQPLWPYQQIRPSTGHSLPLHKPPTSNTQLTTKVYVDSADSILNARISTVDSAQKSYIDASYGVLDKRITDTDSARKSYMDASYGVLDKRITDTDSAQKLYFDASYGVLDTRITTSNTAQKSYSDGLNTTQKTYIDSLFNATNRGVQQLVYDGQSENYVLSGTDLYDGTVEYAPNSGSTSANPNSGLPNYAFNWLTVVAGTFIPLARVSIFFVEFDCLYRVRGDADNTVFGSQIVFNPNNDALGTFAYGYRLAEYKNNRSGLFPIKARYNTGGAFATNKISIGVQVGRYGTGTIVFPKRFWTWSITEIQLG